ncbi:MAG: hypothetical protein AAF926_06605 [Pseudomonadota bacterium]
MTISAKVSGVWESAVAYARVSGVWEPISAAWVKVSGTWEPVSSALSVSVSPSGVTKFGTGAAQSTSTVTATVTGGIGPFTYSWTRASGSTKISAISPSAASTAFQSSGLSPGESAVATFIVTVTDTATGNQVFDTVSVTIEWVI